MGAPQRTGSRVEALLLCGTVWRQPLAPHATVQPSSLAWRLGAAGSELLLAWKHTCCLLKTSATSNPTAER